MRRIYYNSDLKINLEEMGNVGDTFTVNFFTTSTEYSIERTEQDIIEENSQRYLKLSWTELSTIGRGVLNYILNKSVSDSDYDDGEQNKTISRTTDYYIVTDLIIDDGDDEKTIREALADLTNDLNQLTTEFEYERNQRKVDDEILQGEIDAKANTSDLSTVATSGDYDDLIDKPTIPTVPSNVSAFVNDAGYVTMQSMSNNYYTKSQIDNKKQDKLTNGWVSQIVDEEAGSSGTLHKLQLVTELNQTIDSIATSQDPYSHWGQGDDHTLATIGLIKAHIPTVPTNVSAFTNDASYITMGALTGYATQQWVLNKGYLTSQALGNYYTKQEIDAMIGSIETSLSQI